MSVVPIGSLAASDLALLGNNISLPARKKRRQLQAVNRSLSIHGEQVRSLHRPGLLALPAIRRRSLAN